MYLIIWRDAITKDVCVCVCFVAGIDLHHFNDDVKVHNVFIIRIQIPRS